MQDGSVSPIKAFFRNKWVRSILVLDLIAIIFIIALVISNATKTSAITFNVVPAESQILINGENYINGTYHITPGTYEVEISHPDLDTKIFTVDLEHSDIATITTFLHQGNDFNFYELKENLDSLFELTNIASAGYNQTTDQDTSAETFIADFQRNYDLYLTKLPIVDQTPSKYGIEYGVNYEYDTLTIQNGDSLSECEKTICLYITDTSGEKEQFALSVIEKFGFDKNLYQVVYEKVDYE